VTLIQAGELACLLRPRSHRRQSGGQHKHLPHLPPTPPRLVPQAFPSATALDAVLARLVLAEGRRGATPSADDIQALSALLARRPVDGAQADVGELLATRLPA
jgi:hypothetical protein